jgi:hypothetical protein
LSAEPVSLNNRRWIQNQRSRLDRGKRPAALPPEKVTVRWRHGRNRPNSPAFDENGAPGLHSTSGKYREHEQVTAILPRTRGRSIEGPKMALSSRWRVWRRWHMRWLDETTKTAQKGWVGCGIAQGSDFYSPEARGNKEREGFKMDSVDRIR